MKMDGTPWSLVFEHVSLSMYFNRSVNSVFFSEYKVGEDTDGSDTPRTLILTCFLFMRC